MNKDGDIDWTCIRLTGYLCRMLYATLIPPTHCRQLLAFPLYAASGKVSSVLMLFLSMLYTKYDCRRRACHLTKYDV
ncbi:hypothetical protein OE88DRAFT_1669235 [Heliocybe sulcata]|uniref:Uncharacterized protein n=1 Tax=Heliocybe sulcata TaxID=5364 RepID=A0A5C3MM81_9AGAM|nr:hypothetical protein OE88DRAFT_1669235 [Heliocybe sulcata]